MKRKEAAAAALIALLAASCAGCAGNKVDNARSADDSVSVDIGRGYGLLPMPSWLDLYRKTRLVGVSTVDNVVVVTFETAASRSELFGYYSKRFNDEEAFASLQDYHDFIVFIKAGYGVKITLLDPGQRLWSVEYHRQAE